MQALSHKETVDIKDLDETTTAEEVVQAVTGPGIVTAANMKLRASYSGTQAANVLLPVAAIKKLMKTRKLRVRVASNATKSDTWHGIVRVQLTDRPYALGVDRRATRQ